MGQTIHEEFKAFQIKICATKIQAGNAAYKEELKRKIKDFRGSELPLFPSYELAKSEMKEIIRTWKAPANALLDNIMTTLSDMVLEKVKLHMKRFPGFASIINQEIDRLLENTKELVAKNIDEMLEGLVEIPYTQNDYFEENVLKILSEHMASVNVNTFRNEVTTHQVWVTAPAPPFYAVRTDKIIEIYENHIKNAATTKATELQPVHLQATIQAYVNVCYKRFCDYLPQSELLYRFNHKLKNDIEPALRNIVCDQRDNTEKLLTENAEMKQRREVLETTLECLQTCMQILNENII